jgi:ABC-type lipoprotein export system ATPase subunit
MVELKEIYKKYNETNILNNINLKIESGNSIAIIGPSGSGKTTLLNIASLLDTPTSGEILYFGKKIEQHQYTQTRKNFISFVYQQHNLIPELTILENIEIISKFKNSYNKELILDLLNQVGLFEHQHKKPDSLSGGQKQRASIIRAISCNPQILFTDEPTGNLDPKSSEIISNLLLSLTKQQNIALLLITHNIEIAKKCQKIYTITNETLKEITQP